MEMRTETRVEDVPVFNLLGILEGHILNENGFQVDSVSGEVTIALPQSRENLLFNNKNFIVICGDQPDMIRRALEMNVECLILCQAEMPEELLQIQAETCIISTP